MVKKIISVILTLSLVLGSCGAAFADTNDSNAENNQISPKGGVGWHYEDVKIGSKTAYNVPIGYAGGQPANGTVFPNTSSGFYWVDGGYNVNVSISVGYGAMSVSVSPGYTGGSTGNFIAAGIANKSVKLYINRDLTTSKYEHWKVYDSGQRELVSYVYKTVPTRTYYNIKQYPFN